MNKITTIIPISLMTMVLPAVATAENMMISTGFPQSHNWSKNYMDIFIDRVEGESEVDVTFTPFYGGELVSVGRSLDALQGGTISVAAPLLAPYHGDSFPLTDVTQLPTYNTTSQMVTRAFQKLMDSEVDLLDGKTFYEYEIESKGIHAWAIGATPAYSISTTGKQLRLPADFNGLALRAGTSIHTIAANQLGATPVTMPGTAMYEGLSRGTIDGTLLSISDWPAYSLESLLRFTLTGVAFGHWESYLAVSDEAWNSLTDNEKNLWDKTAREVALKNAEIWEGQTESTIINTTSEYDTEFVEIEEMSDDMKAHVASAATNTWVQWIEQKESNGHPAKRTALLYAKLILEEGGSLPEGVSDYLGI